jgi:hypothetical protein
LAITIEKSNASLKKLAVFARFVEGIIGLRNRALYVIALKIYARKSGGYPHAILQERLDYIS